MAINEAVPMSAGLCKIFRHLSARIIDKRMRCHGVITANAALALVILM
jgi:hypothetical protein